MRHSGPILAALALSQGDAPPPGRTADVRPYAVPQQTGGPYGAISGKRTRLTLAGIRASITSGGSGKSPILITVPRQGGSHRHPRQMPLGQPEDGLDPQRQARLPRGRRDAHLGLPVAKLGVALVGWLALCIGPQASARHLGTNRCAAYPAGGRARASLGWARGAGRLDGGGAPLPRWARRNKAMSSPHLKLAKPVLGRAGSGTIWYNSRVARTALLKLFADFPRIDDFI